MRNVWSSDGTVTSLVKNGLEGERNVEGVQSSDDSLGAEEAFPPQDLEVSLDSVVRVVDEITQDVDILSIQRRAELDAGNHRDLTVPPRHDRLVKGGRGVVIRDADGGETGPSGVPDYRSRGEGSVGMGGVDVKICPTLHIPPAHMKEQRTAYRYRLLNFS
jgi:hypothetical protein